jgi:hypothetical protein
MKVRTSSGIWSATSSSDGVRTLGTGAVLASLGPGLAFAARIWLDLTGGKMRGFGFWAHDNDNDNNE